MDGLARCTHMLHACIGKYSNCLFRGVLHVASTSTLLGESSLQLCHVLPEMRKRLPASCSLNVHMYLSCVSIGRAHQHTSQDNVHANTTFAVGPYGNEQPNGIRQPLRVRSAFS